MHALPLFQVNSARAAVAMVRRNAMASNSAIRTAMGQPAKRMQLIRRSALMGAGAMLFIAGQQVAHCGELGKEIGDAVDKAVDSVSHAFNNSDGGSDPVKGLIDQYSGLVSRLGFSGIMGVCTALAFKRVSRQAAVAVGAVFAGLQALAYAGYIKVDYQKVSDDAQRAMDVTGDGKFDKEDVKVIWSRLYDMLAYQLPNSAGFASGFALGFYKL